MRARGFGVGSRGSTRRRMIVFGIFAVGAVSVCLLAYVLQQPVLQVYWAVYARLYPLQDQPRRPGGSKLAEQLAQQQAQRQQSPDGRGGKMNALDLRDGDTDLTSLTKVTSNQRQQKQSNDGGTNEEAAKKQANRAAQEAADQKAASTTALEKPHSKGELEHAIDTGQGQRIAKLDNSGHEGSADESTVQEASTANQKVLAKQDWPEDAQKQKDELRKVAQEKAAQLQEEEERVQWDRAVQEKAAREEELERSIMAAEGEGDTAGKGAREVKQAAPKSLLGDGASKQEAAETEGVLVKATEEPALVSDGAGDSAGIKSLEAALAGQKQSSAAEDVPKTQPLSSHQPDWTGNAQDYRLTKDLAQKVAVANTVMVTWANWHYLDFVLNWVTHLQREQVSAFMVGAMDDALLQELVSRGITAFAMQSNLSIGDFGWGSETFHKMGRQKIALIQTFTSMGLDILVSDVDTVWLRNPIGYMQAYKEGDILTSSDHLRPTASDGALEHWPEAGSAANIGIMLFRASAHKLANEWMSMLEADSKVWDQNAFNDLMRRGNRADPARPDRLFWGYDGTLRIGILPVSTFASGHTFFVQRLAERIGLDPYAAHATFQYSGTPGKRHRMRERSLWVVDGPEYYDPPGGLLVFDMHTEGLVDGSAPGGWQQHAALDRLEPLAAHFKLINAQLQQVRSAMALASVLNRTLVIPELWCGADRWWAPHGGIIPGSSLHLPFPCPLDHVLDLEQMVKPLPVADYGPNFDFREHSLLGKPEMPEAVRANVLEVHTCDKDKESGCLGKADTVPAEVKSVRITKGLTDQDFRTLLQTAQQYKVLKFTDMREAFGGFADAGDQDRFERRTRLYSSLWCCIVAHPGHVWYDMWWDKVPHTDRHSRQIDKPWEPSTGP